MPIRESLNTMKHKRLAAALFELMRRVSADSGTTFLFVTHNTELAKRCDRIVELVDGRIVA